MASSAPAPRTPRPSKKRKTQVGKAPIAPGTESEDDSGRGLLLPHERDQSQHQTDGEPDGVMAQAQRDIEAGLVDTDMRATPGLDAAQRDHLLQKERQTSQARTPTDARRHRRDNDSKA